MNSVTSRNLNLDDLRAIAIIGVVAVHVNSHFEHFVPSLVSSIMGLGRFGVQLFFIISGFLMAQMYTGSIAPIKFYKKRIIRLYPLWILFTFYYFLTDRPNLTFSLILTILMLNDLFSFSATRFSPGGWTISAEVINYLLWPYLSKKSNKFLIVVLIVLTSISAVAGLIVWHTGISSNTTQWVNTEAIWNTIPFFIVGILLFRIYMELELNKFILISLLFFWATSQIVVGQFIPLALLGVASLFRLAISKKIKFLSAFSSLGEHTYQIYFLHWFIIGGIFRIIKLEDKNPQYLNTILEITLVISVVIFSFLCSVILTKLYDLPARNLLAKILLKTN